VPELPEIEVLTRHLRPLLLGRIILGVIVQRTKGRSRISPREFRRALLGAKFAGLTRRGKYLLFRLHSPKTDKPVTLLGHLGMTGRMFLEQNSARLPKHAVAVFNLGDENFIFEDARRFGLLTLDTTAIAKLGPEPLSGDFQPAEFHDALKRSRQAIKVKLLDQTLVAGIGNIYASEALFRARISPKLAANRLTSSQVGRLWRAVREVLAKAIECGSTAPLNFGEGKKDGLFYFGLASGAPEHYEERLRIYGRDGEPCLTCGRPIKRILQAARSTFYCPHCQHA
jgi:formamidopyrimidine-DNA glycosylase